MASPLLLNDKGPYNIHTFFTKILSMNHNNLILKNSSFSLRALPCDNSLRVDKYLATQFPLYSRSFLQKIIDQGNVTVNALPISKGGVVLKTDDTITINFPSHDTAPCGKEELNALGIELVFEHPHFLIINKPAGILVHKPNSYSTIPTVVDWVLGNYQEVASVGAIDRPGIVHRIDKDTSGLLIIPRTNHAHAIFGQKFKDRSINKTYYAVTHGAPERIGTIDYAVGRHPHARTKMHHFNKDLIQRAGNESLRSALTYFKVLEYYDDYSLIEVKPVTGRTHQIRVHFTALGHPLVGDSLYGTVSKLIPRHALHAYSLGFTFEDEKFSFVQPLPADFKALLEFLAEKNSTSAK